MFIKFNEEAQKVLKNSKKEMQKLKHIYVGSEHFLLSLLKSNTSLCSKLNIYGLTYNKFRDELIKIVGVGKNTTNYIIWTPLLKRVLINAIMDTKDDSRKEVTLENIFLALLDEGEGIAVRIINNLNINIDDLYLEINNKTNDVPRNNLLVYEYGIDLNKLACENKLDPLIGRDDEVNRLIEILLRRTKNNPLLIGEAGVGKTAIVEGLAMKIVKGDVPNNLLNMKIVSIQTSALVSGTKYRGEFEERINKILKEVEDSNIILFIDEIHTLVGAGGAEGAIDASNIIKPSMARGKIRLIGATTIDEYKSTIKKDKALNRRFQDITIEEPNLSKTKNIMKNIKKIYEEYHNIKIDDNVLDELVNLTNKYMPTLYNPDKSIDILDEVCVRCSLTKNKYSKKIDGLKDELKRINSAKNNFIVKHNFNEAYKLKNYELSLESKLNKMLCKKDNHSVYNVTIYDVAKVLRDKSHFPIYEVLSSDYNSLKTLNMKLKNIVVGQDKAIDELVKTIKRIQLGFRESIKPLSILFQGSSGVGKTMLVKEYCKLTNMPLIRLDMSEYREDHTVSKIIGCPPGYVGYSDNKNILEKVKDNPYGIILLDEIEKASPSVLNLFLQILDEGRINDSSNNMVDFSKTVIIMTSNIGCLTNKVGFINNEMSKQELRSKLSTELVNRIEKVIVFNKLTRDNIRTIVNNMFKVLKKKYAKHDIKIYIKKDIYDKISEKSNYNIEGARRIKHLLEEEIDNIVLDALCDGKKRVILNSNMIEI